MMYTDPRTTKIEDWKWKPLEQVQQSLGLNEIPEYIQEGYGEYMKEMRRKALMGQLTPRDLIKAYTITQSSIGRGGLSHATATKTGMKLPNTGGEVRPEGAYSEWLKSKMGQAFLNAAVNGQLHKQALEDIREKFSPFGKQNDQVEKMIWATQNAPHLASNMNQAVTGDMAGYRDWAGQMKGIAGAKSGFIGSLLGRGDLPTLDARQINLHSHSAPIPVTSIMQRGKGLGGREAVDRLIARQEAMGLGGLDQDLQPHYQHLAHHAVWDKVGGTKTSHADLVQAMRGYAGGGNVHPIPGMSPLAEVRNQILQDKGLYGARRLDRAAAEIPGLDQMYTPEAIKFAMSGDNAQAVMTMHPGHFENYASRLPSDIGNKTVMKYYDRGDPDEKPMTHNDYIRYLMATKHFEDVPMLQIDKDEQGLPMHPFIVGHEGRHRSRAMSARGDQASLVHLRPRAELREPFPRRSQEDYIEALKQELALMNNMVIPQKMSGMPERLPIRLPDIYAEGGTVGKSYSVRDDDGNVYPCNDFWHARNKAGKLVSYKKTKQAHILEDGDPRWMWELNQPLKDLKEQ